MGEGFCHSAAAAEANAIWDALVVCIVNGFEKVTIESDAKVIIHMLRKELPFDFSLECILGDIESLARRLSLVTFTYVPRDSNCAVYSVAKFVFKEGCAFV